MSPEPDTLSQKRCDRHQDRCHRFNHLQATHVWQAGCLSLHISPDGSNGSFDQTEIAGQESKMFAGTNNRVLDSFYFRIGILAVAFAAWAGAGYVLLALA